MALLLSFFSRLPQWLQWHWTQVLGSPPGMRHSVHPLLNPPLLLLLLLLLNTGLWAIQLLLFCEPERELLPQGAHEQLRCEQGASAPKPSSNRNIMVLLVTTDNILTTCQFSEQDFIHSQCWKVYLFIYSPS